jgi:DNA polymerase III subunit alpha
MILNCHTYFSLCYGALSPEDMLFAVKNAGHNQVCITDINNTSAVIDSIRLGAEIGIEVKIGIDFRDGVQQQFVAIARNNDGFRDINTWLSKRLHHPEKPLDSRAPYSENTNIIYPLAYFTDFELRHNEWIGISIDQITQIAFSVPKRWKHKLVILQTTTFVQKRDFNAHRLLRAIDKNVLLSKLPVVEQGSVNQTLIGFDLLVTSFANHPEILANTQQILDDSKVSIEMGKLSHKNKASFLSSELEDIQLLRTLAFEELENRYSKVTNVVLERLEKELRIIEQMKFSAYFLMNWDIVAYARRMNYFYIGRGSGANSIVAYLLRITDVDPIELDLYFERFINPHRNNPPDFDIDFSWTDRDDITRYIFDKYGLEHTALLGTYTTFQHDSVIRELGKVFGLPATEIDKIQSLKIGDPMDSASELVLRYSQLIGGMPHHLSIHSSGILISEEPISSYTATFMPPKGYPTTQFSMIEAEDIGLAKFDILSQRGLSKIKDTVDMVRDNLGIEVAIHDITKFKSDHRVKENLKNGNCIGCFYIESPAMRMLLTKLKAEDYLRLVAASSIIRPGVSKSGMMSEYILRFRNEDRREQARMALPELYAILEETYGVMVYQEDVIKIAHIFAGLSLSEADFLRRGMSWKFKKRNEFQQVKNQFFNNCKEKNYPETTIENIWVQIESFANFAFSKAHSASYAVESFQALYLKSYYPIEYMVSTINNGGGYYRAEFYVHEARMCGAEIYPPDINISDVVTIVRGVQVYLGFQMINGMEAETIRVILNDRNRDGEYSGLVHFLERTRLPLEQVILLVRVGAFNSFNANKKELLWQTHLYVNPKPKPNQNDLFYVPQVEYQLPVLSHSSYDNALDEIELLGFPLCSPFLLLKDSLEVFTKSIDLPKLVDQQIQIIGYLCSAKRTYTSKGEKMYFGTFIDLDGHWIDTVHFPPSASKFPFRGPGVYLITGQVTMEYDHIAINVSKIKRQAMRSR